MSDTPFLACLRAGIADGGFETDDVLALLLPLFRQIAAVHEHGHVAPLQGTAGLIRPDGQAFAIADIAFTTSRRETSRLEAILKAASHHLEVVGESRRTTYIDLGQSDHESLDVASNEAAVTRPIFLPDYVCWEHTIGHHDPVTDIFSLGQLLASLGCGLDFTDREDVELFARHRTNLFVIAPRLHPVLARVIVQMTELDRHRRGQDLGQLTRCLETYREQPLDFDLNAFAGNAVSDRRRLIQEHLRDRLFEISRRNRLIHFRPTQLMLNLTVASVPLVMDVRNIRLEQLFLWHPELAADLSSGKRISLGQYLRIEDAPYIPGVLDKIIAEARRDRAEYGFAQLRLVTCFLRWHNLKEAPEERIHSPLLLLPVELVKRKGVRDAYVLTATSSEAEVNPALRHHLRTLYGINLPEIIDLQQTSLDALHTTLQQLVHASEPGVTLEKIDRPKIELIHAKARQRLNQWRKRQRPRRTPAAAPVTTHSYDAENYRPRGLQVFLDAIKPRPAPLSHLLGAPPPPRVPGLIAPDEPTPATPSKPAPAEAPVLETESEMYTLREGESGNPYHWAFDLCALTLGNFHYRKMTLVRDYAKLGETPLPNPAFDATFSLEPRPTEDESRKPLPLRDQYPVIPCDAAQAASVARARDGRSLIIQGPPGTGKSQTITNLVADYLAQGKRVLFVCEKRAAIDVVFHRLRQQGLDELCCLIHDSQADKKAFIQNLKQTYEQWLTDTSGDEIERARDHALRVIEQDLAALDRVSQAMTAVSDFAGVSTRELLHRLVETREKRPSLSPAEMETLPSYRFWLSHGSLVLRLATLLRQVGAAATFGEHPFSRLGPDVVRHPRSIERLHHLLDAIEPALDAFESSFELVGLPEELWDRPAKIGAIVTFAHTARPLAERQQFALLDGRSALATEFDHAHANLLEAQRQVDRAREATTHWRDALNPTDTAIALESAQKFEAAWWRWLSPSFRRLRATVRARHDFSAYAVAPTLTRVLQDLQTEHNAVAALELATTAFAQRFGAATSTELLDRLSELRGGANALRRWLLESADPDALVLDLAELQDDWNRAQTALAELLNASVYLTLAALRDLLERLREAAPTLPDFLPLLTELDDAPDVFAHALRHVALPLDQFEAAMAAKSLEDVYRADPTLARFDGRLLEAHRARVGEHHREWLKSNATTIRHQVRRNFRQHVQLSNLPAAQLTADQKVFKKTYSAGRRELEHEFGKTMRYKSIRDLAAGATGDVVRDLKPVWLMSPLSVSDTLPLDPTVFDVVIFDEASQIPVEEAVPAIYRASQIIVVGDEMQLPPTNFFSGSANTASSDENADNNDNDEDEAERIEVDLDADSLLAQAARNLPSTLLAWHYRSRSEALISFSNAAFYGGNLFTIPDRHLPLVNQAPLRVEEPEQGATNTNELLGRSISFHRLENGVYEQRRNASEARYIAHTVRELLSRETGQSIGIVAFSEAQQSEIDRALDALAEEDPVFAARLEAEVNREEDDQFCGLFIKNLENVQGDERDIIILSICYGYDRSKRMLMNFGPINQRGGEKRLNVIFSRARHHMAVVSSIRHTDITNDYNDGANALRNFLHYAETLSRGDTTAARGVIENLNPLSRRALAPAPEHNAVAEQLAAALQARGHTVDQQIGQSRFRCDLAVRSPASPTYALGLLIDTADHYRNPELLDRYVTRPAILQAFGWRVMLVLTKDWFHEPQAVLQRIELALRGEPVDVASLPEPEPGPEPEPEPEPEPQPETAPVPVEPTVVSARSIRRLEFRAGSSEKFWEVSTVDTCLTVRFGRIGTKGQTQEKRYDSAAEALQAADQLTQAKLRKGYVELGS